MIKRLYTLNINNYWPEMCQYSIPTFELWAKLNGWEFTVIKDRKFHDMPITTEKLQIWELGRGADWNLFIDADVMLRPDFLDPSTFLPRRTCASSYSFGALAKFEKHRYWERDTRGIGISGGFVISSDLTHELWEPPADLTDILAGTKKNLHLADEYVISRNVAKYGLAYSGVCNESDTYIVHFGGTLEAQTHEQKAEAVAKAAELWLNWSEIWPLTAPNPS